MLIRNLLISICLSTLLVFISNTAANETSPTNKAYTILSIFPWADGMHVQLSPSNGVSDWGSNFHGTQVVIIYGGTGTMYNTLIATLLTAYSNGKRISDLDFSVLGSGDGSLNNQWSIKAFKVID